MLLDTHGQALQNKRMSHYQSSVMLGHDSELTTRIYLSTLDNVEIDKANKMILNFL